MMDGCAHTVSVDGFFWLSCIYRCIGDSILRDRGLDII